MNQGKLEVVKQEMARVNVDILGISKLKWTRMGEFNSDDHYIYDCGQESTFNVGDLGLTPGLGRSPGERNGNPCQYSCLENPHGQRELGGYSPWGHKELDTTE